MATVDEDVDDQIEADPQDDRRALILALFLLLLKDTQSQLAKDVRAYFAGTITIYRLSDLLTNTLMDSHAHAAYLGRRLSGSTAPFSRVDRGAGTVIMFGQLRYLEGLIRDIEAGRYPVLHDGSLPRALTARLQLYANALRNTADRAWIGSLDGETLINWNTTAKESCPGCLAQEAANPHVARTMTTLPGGETCGASCRCELQIVGGAGGFTLD